MISQKLPLKAYFFFWQICSLKATIWKNVQKSHFRESLWPQKRSKRSSRSKIVRNSKIVIWHHWYGWLSSVWYVRWDTENSVKSKVYWLMCWQKCKNRKFIPPALSFNSTYNFFCKSVYCLLLLMFSDNILLWSPWGR